MKSIFLYSKSVLVGLCLYGVMGIATVASAAGPAPIPHDIDAYEISSTANACVMCHRKTDSVGEAQDTSPSHFIGSDGKEQDTVVASYYQCTNCHVAAAKPTK